MIISSKLAKGHIITKKTNKNKFLTTHDGFIKSMTPPQKKEYDEGYRDFLLSELLIAIMKNDEASVRELAQDLNHS